MRNERLLCDKWEFCKAPFGTEYSDSLDWKPVDLPHDWLIYDTRDLYGTSTGWYRRVLPASVGEERVSLRFEGVYMDCRVYVNSALAGEWKYGYSSFELDITDLLRDGDNLVAVRVDHQAPNSRWYSGAGIYRKVLLRRFDPCHITPDGVYISADMSGALTVSCETQRPSDVPIEELSIRHTILYKGEALCSAVRPCCSLDRGNVCGLILREGCSYTENTLSLRISEPRLWDTDSPELYTCVTELLRNGEPVDRAETRFGFRRAEFTPDKGFFLNGKPLKLHGACEHHDLGALGAAFNRTAMRRKLEKLRSIGVNAVRTSHNMPAAELMELADEMGFLILSEGFDMWEKPKTEYDYARFFPEWAEKDVASWVRRDRNHPSLVGWSIGNEIFDECASPRGQEVAAMLLRLVRLHDPRANAVVTHGCNYMMTENGRRCADILKIAGYNYGERMYAEHHAQYPDWCIYGSETASTLQSRGVYHFPYSQSVLSNDDEQCSSLGNCSTGWGAADTEACIIDDRDAEYCAGQFIWTGFDYIGEPTPYTTKNSYFGQFDTAGFEKDSAYIYRAEWTSFENAPFVHIFPYWDFSEGEDIDIRVTSNCPRVELFANGKSIASKDIDHLRGRELLLHAVLKYAPGELTAVAYGSDGRELARDSVKSFGDTAELRLTPDKPALKADGQDLIFLDISAFDRDGTFVANANDRVFVEVAGAGRLIGLDNGDSTDYDQYKGTSRRLFSGKLLAIIAAKTEAGEILVKASSPALPESTLTLRAEPCEAPEGVSALTGNLPAQTECPDAEHDIPVRKIEFLPGGRTFTADNREMTLEAVIRPGNSTYKDDIEYRITTVLGIPSNLAEITETNGNKVAVRCMGDGEFYLRALCKNGTEKYHVLSTVKLSGSGIGKAALDPYELVPGGLHSLSGGNIGNGIQHGSKFGWEPSWIGFESVDFGSVGSDRITLPIFANCTNAVHIRVYEGTPGNGELLGDFTYQKEAIWLTYQPETYTLSKRLKGVKTISLESSDGFDIEGFRFERFPKETAEIFAADAESVYGDKFTKGERDVTGIGNNVMLDFGEFDFSEKFPSALVITGRTPLPMNSVNVYFKGEVQQRVSFEFAGSPGRASLDLASLDLASLDLASLDLANLDFTARSFPLGELGLPAGRYNVSFAFLPGSDFDFRSIRFE